MRTYARRAVGWTALLGATALLALLFVAARVWPDRLDGFVPAGPLLVVVPVALLVDERALAIVQVAPRRGRWRLGVRALAATVPLSTWMVGIWMLSGRMNGLRRGGWWLIGIGAAVLAFGLAAFLARRGSEAPGTSVSCGLVLLLTLPFVHSPLPASIPIFPVAGFPGGTTVVWLVLLSVGLIALAMGSADIPRR